MTNYEQVLKFDHNLEIIFEYSYNGEYALQLGSWTLWDGSREVFPDRDTADEIENELESWLNLEYNKAGYNYEQDLRSKYIERMADLSEDR